MDVGRDRHEHRHGCIGRDRTERCGFLGNVGVYWGSQLAFLAVMHLFCQKKDVMAGAAFALALYLAGCNIWLKGDFFYLVSLPLALPACIGLTRWYGQRTVRTPMALACIGAVSTVAGLAGAWIVLMVLLYRPA